MQIVLSAEKFEMLCYAVKRTNLSNEVRKNIAGLLWLSLSITVGDEAMITVEVFAPVIDKMYEFVIDENAAVSDLKEEICVMICQKEQYSVVKDLEDFMLCSIDKSLILSDDDSAAENNIKNGERLIIL